MCNRARLNGVRSKLPSNSMWAKHSSASWALDFLSPPAATTFFRCMVAPTIENLASVVQRAAGCRSGTSVLVQESLAASSHHETGRICSFHLLD